MSNNEAEVFFKRGTIALKDTLAGQRGIRLALVIWRGSGLVEMAGSEGRWVFRQNYRFGDKKISVNDVTARDCLKHLEVLKKEAARQLTERKKRWK